MAMGTSVPPRAYTREILTTAFNWLQSQPDSVRTKATTPDALVGLYLQAQRGVATPLGFDAEAPVSSQVFMSDLKNLARGLEEFDDSRTSRAVSPPSSSRAQLGQPAKAQLGQPAKAQFGQTSTTQVSAPASRPTSSAEHLAATQVAFESSHQLTSQPTPDAASEAGSETSSQAWAQASTGHSGPGLDSGSGLNFDLGLQGLNPRSLAMLRAVQEALNLSSEVEALNLMIAVAHKNLKSLLA